MADRYVDLEVVEIKAETQKAFLVLLDDDSEHWIPFSQIDGAEKHSAGDKDVVLSITEWIAEEKGLEPL